MRSTMEGQLRLCTPPVSSILVGDLSSQRGKRATLGVTGSSRTLRTALDLV